MWWEEGNTQAVGGVIGLIIYIGILWFLSDVITIDNVVSCWLYPVIIILSAIIGSKVRYGEPTGKQIIMMILIGIIPIAQIILFKYMGIGIVGKIRGDI